MEKLIIQNNSELSPVDALIMVIKVIDEGKVSGKQKSDQYCYLTIFDKKHQVSCVKNKGESFTFRIENLSGKT